MTTLIIYDSNYGNTKKIAETIAKDLGENQSKVVSITELNNSDLTGIELLIVGSPINGWRPTQKIQKFLNSLKKNQLTGISAASFDTRIDIFFHGDAAKKISRQLEEAGAGIIVKPEGFFVKKGEGPLKEGEIDRAKVWAGAIRHAHGRI